MRKSSVAYSAREILIEDARRDKNKQEDIFQASFPWTR